MKTLCAAAAALVVCATTTQAADAWTCSYVFPIQTMLKRFTIADKKVTDAKTGDVYDILQDNEYGLIATRGVAEKRPSDLNGTAVAATFVILKKTGEFRFSLINLGGGELSTSQSPIRGICIEG